MRSQAIVWRGRLEQEEFFKKKKRNKRHSVAIWGILLQQQPRLPAFLPLPSLALLPQ